MTLYRLEIPPEVADIVRHLAPELKRSVKEALRGLSRNPTAGEPLRRELKGLWKYRVRRYRVVYAIEPRRRVVRILAVGPRVEIYENAAASLRRPSKKQK
ncbi:MAG TPA: type II toxin-antitoxin system RelE/ParE family toxin [Vicinamibacteria bacterium]|nr:type II toxin-antitoxin system RelE/ParE family toxin [Vicinamibacteria bacterium]